MKRYLIVLTITAFIIAPILGAIVAVFSGNRSIGTWFAIAIFLVVGIIEGRRWEQIRKDKGERKGFLHASAVSVFILYIVGMAVVFAIIAVLSGW